MAVTSFEFDNLWPSYNVLFTKLVVNIGRESLDNLKVFLVEKKFVCVCVRFKYYKIIKMYQENYLVYLRS